MGRPRGLEPPTPGTTNQCSNQLSYDRHGSDKKRLPLPRAPLRGAGHEGKNTSATQPPDERRNNFAGRIASPAITFD